MRQRGGRGEPVPGAESVADSGGNKCNGGEGGRNGGGASGAHGGARLRNGSKRFARRIVFALIITDWTDTLPSRGPRCATPLKNDRAILNAISAAERWARGSAANRPCSRCVEIHQ